MSGLPSYDGLGAPRGLPGDAPEGIGAPPRGGWRGYYLTAYGIAVKHGFRGSEEEWLKTLEGERGERAELRFNGENKRLEYRYESEEEWRTLCELKDIQGDMVTAVLEEARGYTLIAEEHEKGAERHEAASERYTAEAESWAHGETGVRKGEDEDNGKYYARVAAARAADAEDSAVRAETAAETAAEDASRHAVEDAAELLSGYVSDAETARSGAESAAEAARSSGEQAAASAGAAQSSAEASENSAKNSSASENAADAARRSAEAARDAAEDAGEKARLESLDAELAREGAETAAKDSAAARDAAAASADAAERAAVRAEEIVGQDFATKEYVADAVSEHDVSPEAHADIRAELAEKADRQGTEDALAEKADKASTEAALADKAEKTELAEAKKTAETALSEHDASPEAHGDIRELISGHTGNTENPHKVTAEQVHARPDTWTPTAADVGAAPITRTVNSKPLSEDITLSAADVGAVPVGRTVNGHALVSDVTLGAGDIAFEDGETFQQKLDSGSLKGEKGETGPQGPAGKDGAAGAGGTQGPKGDPGAAAGFGEPTASVDSTSGTPTVKVTATGPDTAKVFDFAFSGLVGPAGPAGAKGETGAAGATGPAGPAGPTGPAGKDGAPGKDGSPGATGPQGPAGPNTVSTTTSTNISGILKGNGANVLAATAGTDYVPPTRTVNGKALSADITLGAADVSARPSTWMPTAANVGALPTAGGTMTGNIAMGNHLITGLGAPSAGTDAATKNYVDSAVAGAGGISGVEFVAMKYDSGLSADNRLYFEIPKGTGTIVGVISEITLTTSVSGMTRKDTNIYISTMPFAPKQSNPTFNFGNQRWQQTGWLTIGSVSDLMYGGIRTLICPYGIEIDRSREAYSGGVGFINIYFSPTVMQMPASGASVTYTTVTVNIYAGYKSYAVVLK